MSPGLWAIVTTERNSEHWPSSTFHENKTTSGQIKTIQVFYTQTLTPLCSCHLLWVKDKKRLRKICEICFWVLLKFLFSSIIYNRYQNYFWQEYLCLIFVSFDPAPNFKHFETSLYKPYRVLPVIQISGLLHV